MELSDKEDKCQEPEEPLCKGIDCGGTGLDPQGFCLAGDCICNNQWHGKLCEERTIPPKFVNDSWNVFVFETENLNEKLPLANGSKTISYTVENHPPGLTLLKGNTIKWSNMTVGTYSFHYKAINRAGYNTMTIKVQVSSCYVINLGTVEKNQFWLKEDVALTGTIKKNRLFLPT